MRIRQGHRIVASFLLSAGLVTWSGCNAENPDGTPNTLGKVENKAGEIEKKVEKGAEKLGEKAKEEAAVIEKNIEKGAAVVGEKAKEGIEKVKDAVTPSKP